MSQITIGGTYYTYGAWSMEKRPRQISGSLWCKEEDGKFYWAIEGCKGNSWEEITESLYNELISHKQRLQNKEY